MTTLDRNAPGQTPVAAEFLQSCTDAAAAAGRQLAREYLRVSKDDSGEERSPEEQHDANLSAATKRNWVLSDDEYRDIGSASRHQRKKRKDFDKLIEDLTNNTFNAQILIMWVNSRGSRKLREWLDLIDLLIERKVKVFVTTHDRLYDPENRRDRKSLLEDALQSEDDAEVISENVRRTSDSYAEKGKVWGRLAYGFRRIYDEKTRKLLRQEPEPSEAPNVVELIDRLYKKESLISIENDWDARGIRTRSGAKFTRRQLRLLAMNYAYIGMRVHDRERWSEKSKYGWMSPSAKIVRAQWPALVDEKKFYAVQRRFAKTRVHGTPKFIPRNGRAKNVFTSQPGVSCASKMKASDDICNSSIVVNYDKSVGAHRYRCNNGGHISVPKDELDALLLDTLLAYLAREDNFEPAENNDEELEQVRTELSKQRKEHDDLALLSVGLAARMEPPILAEIGRLETRERALMMPAELDGPLRPGADIAERWHAPSTPLGAKRDIVRVLFTPQYLGQVRLSRVGKGRLQPPVAERVSFVCAVPADHPCRD